MNSTEPLDSPNMEDVMRRLKKILALSESSSPGEAAAAIQQAQSLMAKYNITEEGIAMSEIAELGVNAKTVELERWEGALSSVVANALGCAVLVGTYPKNPAYKGTRRPKASIKFVGTAAQTRIAGYAFEHLRKQLLTDLQKVFDDALTSLGHKKGEVRPNAAERESFALGWAAAVKQKVKDISPTPAMLDKYVQDVTKGRDPKAYKPKRASDSSDAYGNIGYAMGKSAELNRGVDQGKSNLAIAMASST